MTAPEQVYDIELESALDDEAVCETPGCNEGAVFAVTHHGRHSRIACEPCAARKVEEAAEDDAGLVPLACYPCGVSHIGVADLTVRPV